MNVTGPNTGPPAVNRATLVEAVRRAIAGPAGRVALRLSGLPAAAHRRRVLKVLLQDTAQTAGGQVFETSDGEMLLLGAPEAAAARTAQAVTRLAAPAPLLAETWRLPLDAQRLMAWVESTSLRPPPAPPQAAPGVAGLDQLLAQVPPERVFRRRAILRLGQELAMPGRRLVISRPALAAELGALAEDPDLARHAEDLLALRLLRLLDRPGPINPPGAVLVPLPPGTLPPPASRPGRVAVLPLAATADPDALAEYREALAERGWGLALAGLDAAALRLVALEAIPADWLLLQWQPGLADPAHGLSPADAGRSVLTGCDGPEALAWGRARGIVRFSGPHVETVLAAARLAGCREGAQCGQRQCGERAAATAPAARTGCHNLALLDATLPLAQAEAAA